MRTSIHLLKVCVAVAVCATVAQALAQGQGGGGRRGGFGGGGFGVTPLRLLQIEPVQKELALSDDQKSQVTKLADDARQALGGGGGGGNRPTQEQMQQTRDDQAKKVAEILLPNQQERLDQILLQLQGSQALTETKVAEKLQLTDDQKKQLTDLNTEYQQKRRDLFGGGGGGGRPDQDAMNKLRTEQTDKAMAILTSDQKDQFTKMEGTKFDLDPSLLRGGMGGGNNGGGRRNRNGGNGGGNNGAKGNGQPDA
jgi:hypothetical protein